MPLGLVLFALVGALTACSRPDASPAAAKPATTVVSDKGIGELAIMVNQQIVLRRPGGPDSILVNVTAPAVYPAFPAWSPDGSQLAYVEKHLPTGISPSEDWGDDIMVVSAGGGTPRLIHRHASPAWQVYGLAWTADARALVYGDLRPVMQDGRFAGSSARLTRLDLTTGEERLLLADAYAPSFSRDGTRLAYLSAAGGFGAGGLLVAEADGTNSRTVVPTGKFPSVLFPRLSPDGSAIAFAAFQGISARPDTKQSGTLLGALLDVIKPARASAHGIPMDIWRAEVSTGAIKRLTTLYEDDPCPTWSADGSEVIAIGLRGLYRIALDGSSVRNVGPGAFGAQIDLRPQH